MAFFRLNSTRFRGFDGAVLPVAVALVGIAAAVVERGPLSLGLVGVLLGLCGYGVYTGRQARAARAEAERVAVEHRMLRESVEYNPMPYAVYDDQDRLIAWNKAYEATHAEAFRRLGGQIARGQLRYADLIWVTAQATLPAQEVEAHVAQRVRQQRDADGVAVDREYPRLGWLRVCKFATPSGAVAGFAVDINELKQREAALQAQIGLSEDLARRLREQAETDALTGAVSRRTFLQRAGEEFQRARRYGHGLCVAMLDIDAFKGVNDRYGHGAGDQVLARVVGSCQAQLRVGMDHCGRLGGEEFAILLPGTDLAGAQALAERLCESIRALEFDTGGRKFRVSISIGIAAADERDETFATLLGRADAALYAAKSAGRDRVSLAPARRPDESPVPAE